MSTRNTRNNLDKKINSLEQESGSPGRLEDHIDYGILTAIDYNTYQVQVQLFGDQNNLIMGKGFWPLITQVDEIFSKYGQCRKGMNVRVHWRGRQTAHFAMIEIIGDENSNFFAQQDKKNESPTLPWKLLSGGMF